MLLICHSVDGQTTFLNHQWALFGCIFVNSEAFNDSCNVVVDSYLLSSRCVFKVLLEFLSLINFSNNFHNFIILLNLSKFN